MVCAVDSWRRGVPTRDGLDTRARWIVAGTLAALGSILAGRVAVAGTDFSFSEPQLITFPTTHFPTQIALGDLDGNGTTDVVVGGRDPNGFVYTLLGNGDGTLGEPIVYNAGGHTDWCELRDVNGDSTLDLLMAIRTAPGRFAVAIGVGDGTFVEPPMTLPAGREPRGLAADDFDGDGDIDAAVLDYTNPSVTIFANDGFGGFSPVQWVRLNEFVGGFAGPQQMSAGDLDGDGRPELVVTAIGAGRVSVLQNVSGTAPHFAEEYAYRANHPGGESPGITNSVLADMDNDGDLDVVSSYILLQQAQRFGIMLNSGGSFPTVVDFPSIPASVVWVPAAADLDGDGDLDVIIGSALGGEIVLHESRLIDTGTLTFNPPQNFFAGSFMRFIAPVDLDKDGDVDLLAVDAPQNTLQIYLNETPQRAGGVAVADSGGDRKGGDGKAAGNASPGIDDWADQGGSHRTTPVATEVDAREQAIRVLRDRNGDGRIDGADLAIYLGGLR